MLFGRSLSGEVSWDKILFAGASFDETDETITHQIVDRPSFKVKYISRLVSMSFLFEMNIIKIQQFNERVTGFW